MNDLCLNESEKASVRDQERLFLRTIEKVTATFKFYLTEMTGNRYNSQERAHYGSEQ